MGSEKGDKKRELGHSHATLPKKLAGGKKTFKVIFNCAEI